MLGLLLGVILFLACYILGARGLRLLKVSMEPDEEFVFGSGLGLAFLGNFVIIMGLFHLFNLAAFVTVLGALLVLIALERKFLTQSFSNLKKIFAVPATPLTVFFPVVASVASLSCLMGVLSPEIANDSLCYHLHLPKIFLREGRLFMAPYELNTMYPFFMEMLFTFGLGLSGVTLAKFFHFGTGILASLTVFTWARQVADKKVAWGAAILFLTTPAVINEMGVTYVDVGLAFFALLLVFSIWKWKVTQKTYWLAVGGAFAGVCIGIKYLGIMVLIPAFLLVMVDRATLSHKARGLLALSLATVLFGGFWYVRNYIAFGNPVFPYLPAIFGSGDPLINQDYKGLGVPHTWLDFLKLPFTVTMKPGLFPYGGWGDQIGPGYLAFLPFLLFGFQAPFMAGVIFFVTVYFLLWFFSGQMLRFMIPILPVLAVLVASGWTKSGLGHAAKRSLALLFCVLLLGQTMLSIYHYRRNFSVALGGEAQENYLLRNERSYRIAKYINENLPKDAKVYVADETHLYFFDRVLARDVYFTKSRAFDRTLPAAQIVEGLRRDGFTHILRAKIEVQQDEDASKDPSIIGMIDRGEMTPFLEPVFSDHYSSPRGEPGCSYALFKIARE